MHLVKWTVLLFAFWLLLSGFLQPLLLAFGVISVVLVVWVLHRMNKADRAPTAIGTGHQIMRYLVWLFGQILSSSVHVTKLIWGSSKQLEPTLVTVSAKDIEPANRVLYANSITLTPGTLTVDLIDDKITVHALQASSTDDLGHGSMEQKINSIWKNNK